VGTGSHSTVQVPVLRESASVADPASALERQYVKAVRRILPSIVQIRTSSGLGSGIVFDTRGDIVTNAHVAAGSSSFAVTLADGRRFTGSLVGSYSAGDLAVISIGAHGAKSAVFADSSRLVVGDIVLAAGNPLGLQSSITDGIVSALGRNVSEGGGIVLPGTIQTSAAINPGNSGGALVDLAGRVIGIPTLAAATQTGAAAGIGFAIPSNLVRDIAGQIIRSGHVTNSHRAALGISVADSVVRAGALVVAVQKGGPADRAGITAGDAIVAVNGTAVPDSETLGTVLAEHHPGDTVKVTITRTDGKAKTVTVKLGELAAS
jgi:putative serine protease PepD